MNRLHEAPGAFPRPLIILTALIAGRVLCIVPQTIAAADKPNIVIVMVDDMGFSDIGCYGAEIETPHLDRLARNGLRFTQFYNTGRCCPTRAALLTGLYQHQAGVGHMTGNHGVPSYQGHLNDRCLTIAEALKPSGYFTAISGKWHVGSKPESWPRKRGFDRFYGIPQGGGHHYRMLPGRHLVLDDSVIEVPDGWYTTTAFTDYAVKFLEEGESAGGDLLANSICGILLSVDVQSRAARSLNVLAKCRDSDSVGSVVRRRGPRR